MADTGLRRGWLGAGSAIVALLVATGPAWAGDAVPASDDPALEARVMALSRELRCLVCQNQTIADSQSGLALDLRAQVRERLQRGESEPQILDYMTSRYGDFVLYRPPWRASTWLLWLGPLALALGGLGWLLRELRRRSRLPDDQFEPDSVDPAAPADSADSGGGR
ncbi:MAG: cytochrome c-type biogenesis protein CcmH [Rhodoferax sp.]|nr:cytochrome c-type biogenesis protein CcmH [Rhodoferax sp.]